MIKEAIYKIAQQANVNAEKLTMGLFFVFMMLALAMADIFAFQNGAVATISQVWLTVNQKFWFLTYLLVFWCGVLIQHVSVPRTPGIEPEPIFWLQAALWTPFFWLGLYVGYRYFYQLPNLD